MKKLDGVNRRDLMVALSAFAALGSVPGEAEQAAVRVAPGEETLSKSEAVPFETMPAKPMANGGTSRAVMQGTLPTGEYVSLHVTTLPPGGVFPTHKHVHTEFLMVKEGTLELNNEGKMERVGPGGVILTASNVTHGIASVGDVAAVYFVVSIAREPGVVPV
jgi:quercetin dioxygenase-like cupin family protein